jgi:hypothetical protein
MLLRTVFHTYKILNTTFTFISHHNQKAKSTIKKVIINKPIIANVSH